MTYILGTLPNWIQALAAVFLVGLTGWTLKVLRGYAEDTNSLARDTASLARDSASQLDSAQMPFLAVASKPPEPGGRTGGFVIENQGLGPALNVVCTFFDSANVPRSIPSLGTNDHFSLHSEISTTFRNGQAVEVDYESLSGKKYRTVIKMVANEMRTEFKKL